MKKAGFILLSILFFSCNKSAPFPELNLSLLKGNWITIKITSDSVLTQFDSIHCIQSISFIDGKNMSYYSNNNLVHKQYHFEEVNPNSDVLDNKYAVYADDQLDLHHLITLKYDTLILQDQANGKRIDYTMIQFREE